MAAKISREVLSGFVDEAKSYLPDIRDGIAIFGDKPTDSESLEAARRYIHTIKGAASMVGLVGLSHMAYYIEEVLDDLASRKLNFNNNSEAFLEQSLSQLELYLDNALSGTLNEQLMVIDVVRSYRRLRGLPVDGDATAVSQVLSDIPESDASIDESLLESTFEMSEPIVVDEDFAAELLEAFSLEAEDHLSNISRQLTVLEKEPSHAEALREVRRRVHTLKGAAGTVGINRITDLTHRMEDLLDLVHEGKVELTVELIHLFFSTHDVLEDLVVGEADSGILSDLYTQYAAMLVDLQGAEQFAFTATSLGQEPIIDLAGMREMGETAVEGETAVDEATAVSHAPEEVVRVSLDRLDDLIRLASELVITRSTFEQRMGDLMRLAEELQPSISRMRRIATQLETQHEITSLSRNPLSAGALQSNGNPLSYRSGTLTQDFDELEFDRYTAFHLLSRELSEATSDIKLVGNELGQLIGDFDTVFNRQGRLTSELQDKVMRTRMVPLATLASRFHRAVRVVTRTQSKLVDLVLDGEKIELDKQVLEEIADPLLHVLRNAVDHGIEPPALRQVMGKSERAEIKLRAYHEGNQVVIQIQDDGTGLEPNILRAKAISGGFITEAEAVELTDDDLYAFIFVPGFSTAEEINEMSGRGVGLDILRSNVHRLKGRVNVASTPGKGTTFTIRLPMTLAVTRALMVKANHETFAIPLGAVTQISRLERQDIERIGQDSVVRIGGTTFPALHLGEVLNLKRSADQSARRLPVLILNADAKRIALIVDEVVEGREIVVKPLGNHLRHVHGVTGATLMGDGRAVLILNPTEIVTRKAEAAPAWGAGLAQAQMRQRNEALSILVVDDSVSVRRVVSNLMKGAGWQPTTAKDGLEALETIQSSPQLPDAILLDIEMPRMDGYELATTLQAHRVYKQIPIIMLTSRAGEKHRQKALSAGVDAFLVKPYTDSVLLNTIRHLTQSEVVVNG